MIRRETRHLALYPDSRPIPEHALEYGVQVRLSEFVLRRPRQWGACWVAGRLWQQLQLDEFWQERPLASREGTPWRHVLQTLVAHRNARFQPLRRRWEDLFGVKFQVLWYDLTSTRVLRSSWTTWFDCSKVHAARPTSFTGRAFLVGRPAKSDVRHTQSLGGED